MPMFFLETYQFFFKILLEMQNGCNNQSGGLFKGSHSFPINYNLDFAVSIDAAALKSASHEKYCILQMFNIRIYVLYRLYSMKSF